MGKKEAEEEEEEEEEHNAKGEKCEIVNLWEVLGRKWALLILKNLNTKEAIRFNELKRIMPGISSTVLADRLLELEREGLISKRIYPEIPPKVEYRLTVRAGELGVILKELWRLTQRWKVSRLPATTVTSAK
jgi:DNA-binding HxlR family transcriptional regulator